ncbi:hypothetical protein [Neobacillus dielmonensis]|uniref:hypothetical protein n=1 Tax=Neobacillus dielmonensis TaxID=1347369 RepID=UPI0005A6DB24|nr:hypothetical protein [Neobacillus dielmonensis]
MSKNEITDELQTRLDEFHVKVPDISIKKSKLNRLANWIYAPAADPLEALSINRNSITRIVFYPLLFVLALLFAPFFFI